MKKNLVNQKNPYYSQSSIGGGKLLDFGKRKHTF